MALPATVADPGFPVGGRAPIRGGVDLQCGCFLVKMYVKTKELGPIGGACTWHTPLDPPMCYIYVDIQEMWTSIGLRYAICFFICWITLRRVSKCGD